MEIKDLSDTVAGVTTAVADFKKDTQAQIAGLKNELTDLAQKSQPHQGLGGIQTKTGFSQAVDDAGYKAMVGRSAKYAQIPMNISIKALVGDTDAGGNDLFPVQTQRAPGRIGEDARRTIRLLDVLPRMGVTSNSFEFVQLNSYTNGADYQSAEGDTKAEQTIDTGLQTTNIATLAVTIPVSNQVLADAPILGQFLDSKLRFGVLDRLESELIGGDGVGSNLNGLVTQATALADMVGVPAADRVGKALTQLEIAGWSGGIIIMHPNDWQNVRAERAESTKEYVTDGWASPAGPMMWGVPVVTSNSITENTALVLDPAQLVVLDRQSVVVDMGYVNDQFAQNLVTLRAELRAGLAVFSPSALLSFDLTTP